MGKDKNILKNGCIKSISVVEKDQKVQSTKKGLLHLLGEGGEMEIARGCQCSTTGLVSGLMKLSMITM